MPIKIQTRIFKKQLESLVPNISKRFSVELKSEIVDVVVEKIVSGVSPVEGQGRYQAYSPGYAKEKGRKAPVDLVQSGKMLNSLRATQTKSGAIKLLFGDKKAAYHQLGQGKQPVREMLPRRRGSNFTKDILKKIINILKKAVKKEVTKFNRL